MSLIVAYVHVTVLWISLIPRIMFETILWVINTPLPIILRPLNQISETCEQIDLRLQQFCFWPWQYIEWQTSTTQLDAKPQAQYIGFWNTVWLIANDIILGIALGAFFIEHNEVLAAFLQKWLHYNDIEIVDSSMTWLLNYPGGLKLNTELSLFFGDLYRWMLYAWRGKPLLK